MSRPLESVYQELEKQANEREAQFNRPYLDPTPDDYARMSARMLIAAETPGMEHQDVVNQSLPHVAPLLRGQASTAAIELHPAVAEAVPALAEKPVPSDSESSASDSDSSSLSSSSGSSSAASSSSSPSSSSSSSSSPSESSAESSLPASPPRSPPIARKRDLASVDRAVPPAIPLNVAGPHLIVQSLIRADRAAGVFGRHSSISLDDIREFKRLLNRNKSETHALSGWQRQRFDDIQRRIEQEQTIYRSLLKEKCLSTHGDLYSSIHVFLNQLFDKYVGERQKRTLMTVLSDRHFAVPLMEQQPEDVSTSEFRCRVICRFGRCPMFRSPLRFPVVVDVPSVAQALDQYESVAAYRLGSLSEDALLRHLCLRYGAQIACSGSGWSTLFAALGSGSSQSFDIPVMFDPQHNIAFIEKTCGSLRTDVRSRTTVMLRKLLKHGLAVPRGAYDAGKESVLAAFVKQEPSLIDSDMSSDAYLDNLGASLTKSVLPHLRCMYAYSLCEVGGLKIIVRHKHDACYAGGGSVNEFMKVDVHCELCPKFGFEMEVTTEQMRRAARSMVGSMCSTAVASIEPPSPSAFPDSPILATLHDLTVSSGTDVLLASEAFELTTENIVDVCATSCVPAVFHVIREIRNVLDRLRKHSLTAVTGVLSRAPSSATVSVLFPESEQSVGEACHQDLDSMKVTETDLLYGWHGMLDRNCNVYVPPKWHTSFGPLSFLFPAENAELHTEGQSQSHQLPGRRGGRGKQQRPHGLRAPPAKRGRLEGPRPTSPLSAPPGQS